MTKTAQKETGTPDEVTVEEALRLMKLKPGGPITETIKAGLATELPPVSSSVSEIAAMRPLVLASRLIGLPDVPEESLLDIARELTAAFTDMLGLPGPGPSAAPAGPIQVTVVQDKALTEMTAGELLARLAADPGEFEDITEALAATRLVRRAAPHPWAVPAADGTLDVAVTVSYLTYLSQPGSVPQRLWAGARPTTLEDIFGREARLMVNPFTGQLFSGLDPWGNDWRKLSDADHLSMIWAAGSRPRHRNLPSGELNARQLTDDLFARRRPAYIREIVEDWAEAQRRDPQLASMSRYLTVADAADLTAPPARPRAPRDFRAELEAVAQSHRRVDGSDIRLGEIVITSFRARGGDVVLRNTIVLADSGTAGGDLRGVAFVPRGVAITTKGGDNYLEVYEESYERLARRAGLTA